MAGPGSCHAGIRPRLKPRARGLPRAMVRRLQPALTDLALANLFGGLGRVGIQLTDRQRWGAMVGLRAKYAVVRIARLDLPPGREDHARDASRPVSLWARHCRLCRDPQHVQAISQSTCSRHRECRSHAVAAEVEKVLGGRARHESCGSFLTASCAGGLAAGMVVGAALSFVPRPQRLQVLGQAKPPQRME